MAHLYTVAGVVRASSQSPLNSISACGENCARSLAPPFPTKSETLRGPQVGALRPSDAMGSCTPQTPCAPAGKEHPLCVCSFPAGQVSPASDWHSR